MTSKAIVGSYLMVLAELLERRGVDGDRWLGESGLARDTLSQPDHYLNLTEVTGAIHAALRLSNDPALGLYLSQQLNLHAHGLLGVVGMLSSNVRDSLEVGFRYAATRSPLVDLRLTETDREAVIHVDLNAELPEDVERFVIESLVFSFATMANFLFDGDIPPATVEMSMAEPAHAELYSVFYRAPLTIRFDADGNRLHFRRDVLDRPLPLANQQTRNLVEKQVSQEMERLTRHPAEGEAIIPQVKALITEMPGYYPAMEEVAERLAVTTRTLHRRIEKAGTSFKSLVDNARFAEATRYLEDTGRVCCTIR
ncbi:hypothetical protein CRM90_29090 [Mycobacterium sp. ENV421]|uniref:AraC family transcriptional regulator n=1 Tax=Mycobacterium sp. ENV421 TaxID=1213407 RepID=UPI000C9C4F5A|nr:AraC family transcriptional regulator ligand-binding domain-containing protein [Mycobacterium sp. ENV421]PND54234.1 hypothetical protein CRM90_29090 [Mycobacterium sp. ENV421]